MNARTKPTNAAAQPSIDRHTRIDLLRDDVDLFALFAMAEPDPEKSKPREGRKTLRNVSAPLYVYRQRLQTRTEA